MRILKTSSRLLKYPQNLQVSTDNLLIQIINNYLHFSINKMQEEQALSQLRPNLEYQAFLSSLKNLQVNIYEDIQKLGNLKAIYHETQEKKFLVTFVNIMDRMSNQLQKANEMYQSIDKEIQEHQQCQYLSKELEFYQKQCIELKKTSNERQAILKAQKERQIMLKNQLEYLKRKLYQQAYKQMKYKSKLEAFQQKRKESVSQLVKSNRTFQTRSKSMRLRNKSTQNENLYQQIYKKRARSLRHATSIKAENKMNRTLPLHNKWSVKLMTSPKQT